MRFETKLKQLFPKIQSLIQNSRVASLFTKHIGLLMATGLLGLLLLKNPFSDRTLIPNFEPFPDSFHYVVPARCWLSGEGWKLCRDGASGVSPAVPPLYSMSLLPSFLLNNDPRMFYLSNVVLSFISLGLLYTVTQKITRNRLATFFICFLFVTTYQIYWLPSLAMAENLLLPLFLASIYFIGKEKLSNLELIAAGTVIAAQFATKYANLPTVVGLGGVLALKLLLRRETLSKKLASLFLLALPPAIFFFGIGAIQRIISILSSARIDASTVQTTDQVQDVWFSLSYFRDNITLYSRSFFGRESRFLWDYTPLVSTWVSVAGWFGLGYGFTKKSTSWITAALFFSTVLQVMIMATFYSHDTRYILTLLPTLLLGLALTLRFIFDFTKNFKQIKPWQVNGAVLILIILVGLTSFTRIKSQLALNLKYAETPWWYLAAKEIDVFFNELTTSTQKKPILISAMSPYLLDFYADTSTFSILPLDQMQDFRKTKEAVWGENDYSDLIKLYQQKINQGHPLYVATYGLGNETNLKQSFSAIENTFNLEEVRTGCFDLCKIYSVGSSTESAQVSFSTK